MKFNKRKLAEGIGRKAFKYPLKPGPDAVRELEITLETLRRLWNRGLSVRKEAYRAEKKTINAYGLSKWLTGVRKGDPYLERVNRQAECAVFANIDKAYDAFFSRIKKGAKGAKAGFPRFKKFGDVDSIQFPIIGNGVKIIGNRLKIANVGTIKMNVYRPMEGMPKTITVKREGRRWYASIVCEVQVPKVEPSTNPAVGIDVGLKTFLTTSDGSAVKNPRFLKNALRELRRKNRALDRKKKGSERRAAAKHALSEAHRRVRNLRASHHQLVARRLVDRYGMIALEDLNVRQMVSKERISKLSKRDGIRTKGLARSIMDAGWSAFARLLEAKAKGSGVETIRVDPAWTSQNCSGCGRRVPKGLNQRRHDCPGCGLSLDRDENAARNILNRALPVRIGPAGRNLYPNESEPRGADENGLVPAAQRSQRPIGVQKTHTHSDEPPGLQISCAAQAA